MVVFVEGKFKITIEKITIDENMIGTKILYIFFIKNHQKSKNQF